MIQSFMLTALTDGRRFSHVERLREDPTIPELFGLESVVSDDTVRRFFASTDPVLGAEWIARQGQPLWRALPERIILDWDSTVLTKYGHQEGAEVGYNPTKPGRRSFHPLLAGPGFVPSIGSAVATPSVPRNGSGPWRMRSAGWASSRSG